MENIQLTTPPRPCIPVPPNAPKKQTTYYNTGAEDNKASRVLVLE